MIKWLKLTVGKYVLTEMKGRWEVTENGIPHTREPDMLHITMAHEIDRLRAAAPLTKEDLADALECFWNAAIGEAHTRQGGMDTASIMAVGIAAVATRLKEPVVDPKGPFAAGVWEAVKWVEKRRDDYIREHGSYDPETGATEFPDDGEYAAELDEIVEGLQKLAGA